MANANGSFMVLRTPTSEMTRLHPLLAADLEARGFVASVSVLNAQATARFLAYESASGSLVLAYGSRSLFDRFTSENR